MSLAKRFMTIEDLTKIKRINEIELSPDGQWIAYVLETVASNKRSYERNLYVVSTSGGTPMQITRSGKDGTPRWSPDGSQLAFVSSRSEKPQIYLLPMTRGGEARPLTSNPNGATSPMWSPDGSQMAYLSRMNQAERAKEDSGEKDAPPIDDLEGKYRKERQAEDEKNRFDPRPIEKIPYREGTSYRDDRYNQIYVIPTAEGLEGDAAKARRLTNIDADYSQPQWSSDGKQLYSTRAYDISVDDYFYYSNIYVLNVATGTEERIVEEDYVVFSLKPAPDGESLAVIQRKAYPVSGMSRMVLQNLKTGAIRELTVGLDRIVSDYYWTAQQELIIRVETNGRVEVHKINAATAEREVLVNAEQTIQALSVAKDGSLAYMASTNTTLDEVYYHAAGSPQPIRLTSHNDKFMSEIQLGETHHLPYQNSAGDTIDAWYVLPPNYEAGKKYPLAVNIHGGPFIMWTPSAPAIWHEWQTHAAAGYIVFYCNPRGSHGYGHKFATDLRNNWGDMAMGDILTGIEKLVAKGFVDTERMVISGGSYGGYMTAWMTAHHPEMFKAAVSQRGVYNLNSFYGTSDIPALMESEFDAFPWSDHQKLWEHSPLTYAHQIKTPTLILHSENDFRVPIEQGEQFFATIRRATKTPVKMLRFPREGHEMSRSGEPLHRIQRLKAMLDWFLAYCPSETN